MIATTTSNSIKVNDLFLFIVWPVLLLAR